MAKGPQRSAGAGVGVVPVFHGASLAAGGAPALWHSRAPHSFRVNSAPRASPDWRDSKPSLCSGLAFEKGHCYEPYIPERELHHNPTRPITSGQQ